MDTTAQNGWFDGIETIVADPLRFKVKLAIGEDAYKALRIKKAAWEIWDVAGVAGTGAWAAQLPCVASLLASKGVLASLGLATASTPIGWVILAGVLSGGAWLGITRYLKDIDRGMVDVIPKFINTPLDVLALGLFDLIAPLALGVASIDGRIDLSERQVITSYFVKEWGYDPSFVEKGVAFTESKLADYKIKTLAEMLAEFQKKNPDCNYKMMSNEIVVFLRSVIEADGKIDEREEMAVERVMKTFETVGKFNFKEMFETASNTMTSSLCTAKVKSIELASKTAETASEVVDSLKEHGEKTAKMLSEVSDTTVAHGKRLCECIISKCSKQHGVE